MFLFPIILAAILSIIHYFSEILSTKIEKYHDEMISFSSGLFITQIFLFLFPEFFEGINHIGNNIFLLIIMGFTVFHVLEKYIYQHIKNKETLMKDLAEIHAGGFFIDHFVVGMALTFSFQTNNLLFTSAIFSSLVLHTLSSSISLTHIDSYFKSQVISIALALAPVFGALTVTLLNPAKESYHLIFSFVLGALLYVAIRDMIPQKKEGKVGFFVAGFLLSVIIAYSFGMFVQ